MGPFGAKQCLNTRKFHLLAVVPQSGKVFRLRPRLIQTLHLHTHTGSSKNTGALAPKRKPINLGATVRKALEVCISVHILMSYAFTHDLACTRGRACVPCSPFDIDDLPGPAEPCALVLS